MGYHFFKDDPLITKFDHYVSSLIKFGSIRYAPGVLVQNSPSQINVRRPSFNHENYEILPVASFSLRGRVLSKERYWLDKQSNISPVDIVIGWGPMSDQSMVEKINFSQGIRLYSYDYNIPGFSVRTIISNSANIHLIPSNVNIKNAIINVKEGDIVAVSGYLVNVRGQNSWLWKTSLSREDIGEGSTEIMWVERFVILTGSFPRVE